MEDIQDKGSSTKIGAAIRHCRIVRGLTGAELGRRAKVSQSTISRIELGVRDPSWDTLVAISKGMQVPITHMVAMVEGDDPSVEPCEAIAHWWMNKRMSHD